MNTFGHRSYRVATRRFVVTDLPCRDDKLYWAADCVGNGVQFRIHGTLGLANQSLKPPFKAAGLRPYGEL